MRYIIVPLSLAVIAPYVAEAESVKTLTLRVPKGTIKSKIEDAGHPAFDSSRA